MKSKRMKHMTQNTPERTKTMGHLILENAQKEHPGIVGVTELVQEANKDYEDNLLESIARGQKYWPEHREFYVVGLLKKERIFDEVIRLMWFPRQTCPTPTYSQIVYRFNKDPEKLEFLWVVPDPDTCMYYCDNAIHIAPEERDLLNFILDFRSGSLDHLARDLNGEKPDQPRIVLVN